MKIRDFLSSLWDMTVIMVLSIVSTLLLLIPLLATLFAAVFCIHRFTGLHQDIAVFVVMGSLCVICFVGAAYFERKRHAQWLADLNLNSEIRAERGPFRQIRLRHQHSTYSLVLSPPLGSDEPEELIAQFFMTSEDLSEHNCIVPYDVENLLRWIEKSDNYLKEANGENRD